MEATEDEWPGRVIEMWTERSRGPSQKKKNPAGVTKTKAEARKASGARRPQPRKAGED
jgi:hypothetical protein